MREIARLRRALRGVDVDACSPTEQHGEERAGYGEELVEHPSRDVNAQFGRRFGRSAPVFGRSNLLQMSAFYLAYRTLEIPSA